MRGHIILSILAIILGGLTIKGVWGAIQMGSPFSVTQIVISAISQEIEMDQAKHTNILLLGVGGEGHDGETLTDTMIVASIDHKNKLIPMISIPRDLFVESEALGWGTRINGVYEFVLEDTGNETIAMEALMDEIEKILGINLHYYAKVDFNGFIDIVDAVGGVEVNLSEEFYDPYYPAAPGAGYEHEPFYLAAGEHELDGETALKYVRSRKTTSDFDRAKRQQEVIGAVKDKALRLGLLLNPNRVKNLINAVSNNFETDLELSEMLHLAGLADSFSSDAILSQVISDAANESGGFLYTPERELYEGAYVLIPYTDDYSELNLFADLFLYHPSLYLEETPVHVLNGTDSEGLAGLIKMHLVRYGFNVVRFGNSVNGNVAETKIFSNKALTENGEAALQGIRSLIPAEVLGETPSEYSLENFDTQASILVELGSDFLDFYEEKSERFYFGFF